MPITLKPMNEAEYAAFYRLSLESYADNLCRDGGFASREKALAEAREEMAELLPSGLETPRQFLLSVYDETQTPAGYLWYDLLGASKAFIDDLMIFPDFRRRGYALEALRLLEEALQVPHVALHVFEGNRAARSLFEKAGYACLKVERSQTGSVYMFKRIRG